ncbi:uncharacterized protein BDR25DRAFT_64592 [Lindgomyces ingoldianus]|uniref:Uncharacterized protein n=1 Tax=Lindgomyces ingoldianus TaxID=673940 RepID=A0ACB6RB11_9PLEO|nr:uncharacterized protein BDR25DRAFT_64592 [Lindgomyces ingoldianus]KAF2476235.1 hypothetical protein BDR25DRAFT_64592 [Lindgomyces ingoldianus]
MLYCLIIASFAAILNRNCLPFTEGSTKGGKVVEDIQRRFIGSFFLNTSPLVAGEPRLTFQSSNPLVLATSGCLHLCPRRCQGVPFAGTVCPLIPSSRALSNFYPGFFLWLHPTVLLLTNPANGISSMRNKVRSQASRKAPILLPWSWMCG